MAAGIRQATGDLDLVLERFAALLRISELEAGRRRAGFSKLDLGTLVTQVTDLYEPLAEDRGIALSVATRSWSVEGDDKLLFEALSNLLDNAIKFGRPGGRVAIALTEGPDGRAIEVRDDGPGIAAGERDAVLRRFHRGQGRRTLRAAAWASAWSSLSCTCMASASACPMPGRDCACGSRCPARSEIHLSRLRPRMARWRPRRRRAAGSPPLDPRAVADTAHIRRSPGRPCFSSSSLPSPSPIPLSSSRS
ncbi:ATP-binding protein [Sphingomonas sp. I4]